MMNDVWYLLMFVCVMMCEDCVECGGVLSGDCVM